MAIFYWYVGYLPLWQISEWVKIKLRALDRLTKACRLIAANFMIQNPHLMKIGGLIGRNGKPIKVQIDESACGKMKHHRGKKRYQTWVLGGVEDPETLPIGQKPRSFRLTVPRRDRATLIPILKFFIEAGTIVWSDGWSSYFCLVNHGFNWDWVNHSTTFKDPVTGVHTNAVEGMWKWMKKAIPHGSRRRDIEDYVALFNWKEWSKAHQNFKTIGGFGLLGRASALVKLNDKGQTGDKIPNMLSANRIVAANPLPTPPAPAPKPKYTAKRGRGKRGGRGRGRGRGRAQEAP